MRLAQRSSLSVAPWVSSYDLPCSFSGARSEGEAYGNRECGVLALRGGDRSLGVSSNWTLTGRFTQELVCKSEANWTE